MYNNQRHAVMRATGVPQRVSLFRYKDTNLNINWILYPSVLFPSVSFFLSLPIKQQKFVSQSCEEVLEFQLVQKGRSLPELITDVEVNKVS